MGEKKEMREEEEIEIREKREIRGAEAGDDGKEEEIRGDMSYWAEFNVCNIILVGLLQ
jgi:hypothetical protein